MTRSTKARRATAFLAGIPALALSVAATMVSAQNADALGPLPEPKEINQTRADLGRMLFFDTRMSGDTALSCASCHSPENGWGDGEALSDGYGDLLYFRNAPGLFNVANRNYFMWDGRLDGSDLGTVVRDMLTESHTMNMDSRLAQERLKQVPEYMEMFQAAYGAEPYGGRMYGAIGEFLKTIRTENAPFDAYMRGQEDALSDSAKRGLALFEGKAGCASCHSGAMLSDGDLHATGVPDHPDLLGLDPETAEDTANRQITMLRFYATLGTPNYMNLREDVGQYVVTKDEADIGKFVTPSLWDIGQTAPYMHSGVFDTLAEVVRFYNAGSVQSEPLGLTPSEEADLVAFLNNLTGDAPNVTEPELPDYALRELGQN
ncbi:cytochrome c peroxidase [Aliiroseovarius sediminilitoris]|uniref:Cytochrome c peroxidase n=1 Tax=Aliiroseovarius sediminilitoris TaxID=1173584 RepID=A0A1I0QET8_9RHOB|nr:cytochrome c peroxidase [Aliiroseovarius sediminilitoris]SEW25473.1 cytochrome c peroxidase [Aliiroseovarius sediminilitoris]